MTTIRDGNYGGPVAFFSQDGSSVVIVSPLNEFMISNMKHEASVRGVDNHPGVLNYGLMGNF